MNSKNRKGSRRTFAFHTFLLGIYPVLTLYASNRTEIGLSSTWQAFGTACAVTLLISAFFLLVFRSWEKASPFSSLTILMFFSYGHVFDMLGGVNRDIFRHRFFIPAWLLIFFVFVFLLRRYGNRSGLIKILNVASLFLVAAVFIQLLVYVAQSEYFSWKFTEPSAVRPEQASLQSGDRDVYYILVDSLGRQDLLAEEYQLDINAFTSQLMEMGFYIPECTQSNYDYTLQSLASSLNMQYLDALGVDYFDINKKFTPLLRHSQVRSRFEELGYDTVTFKSLYPALDITDSSYYYDYFKNETGADSLASLNFQYLFLRTTIIRPVIEFLESRPEIVIPPTWAAWIPVSNTLESRDYRQYQQNVFALDTLETMPDLPPKKFVYAHLYVTHQPFVFYPDGRFHPFLHQDRNAYKDQVVFANQRLLQIIKIILEKSKTAPVIIIQGDHSYSSLSDRVKIFNAYYFPDGGQESLYPTITPVNSFRVLFNTYFGGDYPLLSDVSWYSNSKDVLYDAPPTCVNGAIP